VAELIQLRNGVCTFVDHNKYAASNNFRRAHCAVPL
jgi:hypothetical protein